MPLIANYRAAYLFVNQNKFTALCLEESSSYVGEALEIANRMLTKQKGNQIT
jgi:hypothetical protein